MSDKIYCGNAKIVNTSFGELTKISFSKDDINKMVSYMKGEKIEWINLILKSKKDPQPGKPTHYLEVDTWKPDPKGYKPNQGISQYESEDEQLPF